MIITIQDKDGTISQYDIEKIDSVENRLGAKTMISKVGTLDVVAEALSFASAAHRGNLESLFRDNAEEALVEPEEEAVAEKETSKKKKS